MDEFVIKVPAPFSGVEDVGFTARYPAQEWNQPLRDVTVMIEGSARPMARLFTALTLFAERDRFIDSSDTTEAYSWTPPVQLTDEVCVMAFRDRSLADEASIHTASRGYLWNLVRPLAFTFLRDCVRIGELRLAERIALILDTGKPPLVDLELARSAITPVNGSRLLLSA